jgi:hypothetical protein
MVSPEVVWLADKLGVRDKDYEFLQSLDPAAATRGDAAGPGAAIIGQIIIAAATAGVGAEGEGVAAANRQASIARGIPESELGPSGLPKIHRVRHPSLKRAKDAARAEAGSAGGVEKHPTPRRGDPHYHGIKRGGRKMRTHHEFPD